MMYCFREATEFEKIDIARAKLVPVANRASDFKIPKTLRKGGMLLFFFFKQIRDSITFLII